METHICIGCKIEKPLSDYYVYPNGNHYTRCKKCTITYVNTHAKENGNKPHGHELRCLDYLTRNGLPVMEGKYIKHDDYKNIDLVAFGCIRVEVKQADKDNKIWFSQRQRETFRCDLVIVVTVDNTYHVFSGDDSIFIRKSTGKRYVSMQVQDNDLTAARDRIGLFYQILLQKSNELRIAQETEIIILHTEPIAEGKAAWVKAYVGITTLIRARLNMRLLGVI